MSANDEPVVQGPNSWLIDELFSRYQEDPASVPEEWRETFANHGTTAGENGAVSAPVATAPASPTPAPPTPTPPAPDAAREPAATAAPAPESPVPERSEPQPASVEPSIPATTPQADHEPNGSTAPAAQPEVGEQVEEEPGEPLRGVAARIVTNMEASLEVPTATSFREIPAKLLEINRKVLNNHLKRVRGGKVSFTHIIGFAVVRAIASTVPNLNNTYIAGADGKPRLIRNESVNLGIAVDQEKADGSRSLIVPVIKGAEQLGFAEFVDAYEALIAKVRANKLSIDDLTGATVSLTNPGTIGTIQSVPRLMPGQGAIIGVGAIGYPAEYEAADPRMIAQLGISKVITISSTYDHRIIQGAESGLFLQKVHDLLLGKDNFFTAAFEDMGVPYEAVQWRADHGATEGGDVDGEIAKQMAVSTLVNQYRVRGHLIANTNPLAERTSKGHPELDPATYGLTIWDLDREFLTGNRDGIYAAVGGTAQKMSLGDILGLLRDAYSRTIGVEYMHIADPEEKRWFQEQLERPAPSFDRATQHHILERLSAAEAIEKFLGARYVGQKRFGLEGAESAIPTIDAILSAAADANLERSVIGMAHRGRLNVLVNILGKHYTDLFTEFEGGIDEGDIQGSGDVKYHLGFEGKHTSPAGASIDVALAPNPSHLEAVDPVVEGMARAHMDQSDRGNYPILPLLLHGDAAFAGQGVVIETLNLSQVHGYRVGGTVHLIINNQLGYTTAPHQARSSEYSTDVAKAVQAPIFHVNADDPEACVRVARLAWEYRAAVPQGRRDRHGRATAGTVTTRVTTRPTRSPSCTRRSPTSASRVSKLYVETLVEARRHHAWRRRRAHSTTSTAETPDECSTTPGRHAPADVIRAKLGPAEADRCAAAHPHGGSSARDARLGSSKQLSTGCRTGFTVHPKLARQFDEPRTRCTSPTCQVDWATAEALAMGIPRPRGRRLGADGNGEDTRRGTFSPSPRGACIDYDTGDEPTSPLSTTSTGRMHRLLGLRLAPCRSTPHSVSSTATALGNPQRTRGVGGPVRRLRQRCADHHRPVHRRRPRTSGTEENGARACSCPTATRGRVPSTALVAHRAVPHAVPPKTTCRSSTSPRRPRNFFHLLRRQMVRTRTARRRSSCSPRSQGLRA